MASTYAFLFPNYLIVAPGDSFVWDIPDSALSNIMLYGPANGTLNYVSVSEIANLEYNKRYTYEGDGLLVIEYYLNSGSPWAVLLNEQYAAPLPTSHNVQRLRRRVSANTINGRVLFSWKISGKPVYVQVEWENLNPLAASVSMAAIATSRGSLQTLTIPGKERFILLAGPPEVQAILTEGKVQMNWYAAGKVVEFDDHIAIL
jgi:hypothetical protein